MSAAVELRYGMRVEVPVGYDAAQRSDQKYRELTGKAHGAQLQRGSGDAIDQPRLGGSLHPRPNQRNELPAEEKLEVAMAQGTQGAGHRISS